MALLRTRSGDLAFVAARDGLGWRWRGEWYRLKPSWARAYFSERNGYAKIWRLALGWRVVCLPAE